MSVQLAVTYEGRILGYLDRVWQYDRSGGQVEQWVLWANDPPLDFDSYEEACAYLMGREATA